MLDLVYMSDAVGQYIHIVIVTVHIIRDIGYQPCNALANVNMPRLGCVYSQWSEHISPWLLVKQHDMVNAINR